MSVTTADLSRRGGVPRRRLLVAVLAISVALNICVVVGAVWSRLHPPPAPLTFTERFQRLEDTLDLTPAQRTAFDRYVSDMAARGEQARRTVDPMMDAVWIEIAKPDADQARVLQLLDDAGNQRRAFQQQAVTATLSLLATLTPEQRAKFIASEREFRAAQRRRHAEEAR
ncbi:MAG TPA: periplasmic heavy metal sensor [Stellaceae bacterium]|nr:periplasmic heavy metal sensor [Stellaceae bacterium]